MRLRVLAVLLLGVLLPSVLAAQDFDLRPRAALAKARRAHVELGLSLRLTLTVPELGVKHTRIQENLDRRSYTDTVLKLAKGHIVELQRHYHDQWEGERVAVNTKLAGKAGPLKGKTLRLLRSETGEVAAFDAKTGLVFDEMPWTPRLDEPFNAVLPKQPVALGARWSLTDEALKEVLGEAAGPAPRGRCEARLEKVVKESVKEGSAPERIAVVALDIKLVSRDETSGRTTELAMTGTLRFALDGGFIVKVALAGTTSIHEEQKQGGRTRAIDGRGTVRIDKRFAPAPDSPDKSGARWKPVSGDGGKKSGGD